MDISPLGHAAFKLKGKHTVIVTDPYDSEMVGLNFPKHTAADIILVSHAHPDHNFISIVEGVNGMPLIFSGPGEYEAKGVDITGIPTFHDSNNGSERGTNTVYKIVVDGITLVHCGDLGHKLTDEQTDLIDEVDVLFVPVGGVYTIDAKIAAEVVTQLEAKIVVPMHYLRPQMKVEAFITLSPVEKFLKEMGKEHLVALSKLKVTKETIPAETEVVVLE